MFKFSLISLDTMYFRSHIFLIPDLRRTRKSYSKYMKFERQGACDNDIL